MNSVSLTDTRRDVELGLTKQGVENYVDPLTRGIQMRLAVREYNCGPDVGL